MNLSVNEIIKAVNGKRVNNLSKEIRVTSVEFDTRHVKEGCLFIPLKGNRDGHDFIDNAFSNGASLTLSEKELTNNTPYILVNDTQQALQDLATYYLKKIKPKVVAITGSNGKTTTKDMCAAVSSTTFETYKTQGNYNNAIGLPYTILSMSETTQVLILEMGMDHKGEVELLSRMSHPDIAAITLIGESHIEHLGSREGIAEAKMEIVAGLKKEGTLIIPNDEPLLPPLIKPINQPVLTFSLSQPADIIGKLVAERKDHTLFETNVYPNVTFDIPVLGKYNVTNALIAILVGRELNIPLDQIKEGLRTFSLTKSRTEWLETPKGISILSDVYNANPTAMKLVLDSFSKIDTKGNKIVVLGDMLELGVRSKDMHQSISEHLNPNFIDTVYLYGKEMRYLYNQLLPIFPREKVHYFSPEKKADLIQALDHHLTETDTVFFKASNGMKLGDIVDYLLNNH